MPLLSVELSVGYPQKPGVLRDAVLEIQPGEIMGLVGQSGSGKSTFALAILGLLNHTGARANGRVILQNRELTAYNEREMRSIRGRLIGFIPQSPASALNPSLRIGTHLQETWCAHSRRPWAAESQRVRGMLAAAGLPADESFLKRFPREISVGQAQRVLIVMAVLHSPPLLIADEPTSALDPITQRDVFELLIRIGCEQGTSMLIISHDLLLVAGRCTRIAILHEGVIVECGKVKEVLCAPKHPYTRALVEAIPRLQ